MRVLSIRRASFTWKPLKLGIPNGSLLVWLGIAVSLKDVG